MSIGIEGRDSWYHGVLESSLKSHCAVGLCELLVFTVCGSWSHTAGEETPTSLPSEHIENRDGSDFWTEKYFQGFDFLASCVTVVSFFYLTTWNHLLLFAEAQVLGCSGWLLKVKLLS